MAQHSKAPSPQGVGSEPPTFLGNSHALSKWEEPTILDLGHPQTPPPGPGIPRLSAAGEHVEVSGQHTCHQCTCLPAAWLGDGQPVLIVLCSLHKLPTGNGMISYTQQALSVCADILTSPSSLRLPLNPGLSRMLPNPQREGLEPAVDMKQSAACSEHQ